MSWREYHSLPKGVPQSLMSSIPWKPNLNVLLMTSHKSSSMTSLMEHWSSHLTSTSFSCNILSDEVVSALFICFKLKNGKLKFHTSDRSFQLNIFMDLFSVESILWSLSSVTVEVMHQNLWCMHTVKLHFIYWPEYLIFEGRQKMKRVLGCLWDQYLLIACSIF